MKQAATRIEDKEYELSYPVQSRRMQTGHPNPASSFPLRTYPCS